MINSRNSILVGCLAVSAVLAVLGMKPAGVTLSWPVSCFCFIGLSAAVMLQEYT